MAPPRRVSRDLILEQAMGIVTRHGGAALTFQAIADALAVSKQAILYWYPSKWELVADLYLPAMRHEAEVVLAAISEASGPADAIERFIRAFADHYASRLSQFRLLYLPEPLGGEPNAPEQQAALAPIHKVTSSVYGALESQIARSPFSMGDTSPRQLAVAVHMSAVGLLTMFALADALGDPLAQPLDRMIDAVVALQTRWLKGDAA
jgi:AcrR family transcriptional regulator